MNGSQLACCCCCCCPEEGGGGVEAHVRLRVTAVSEHVTPPNARPIVKPCCTSWLARPALLG